MNNKIETVHKKLIVSCQALPEEPLHSSFIMGRMALAAKEGGAAGIRANTKEDIAEIRKNVDLPIIGIVKRDYPDCKVYITPTMKEIDELMEVKPEIIAIDATKNLRPNGVTLDEFYAQIREKYPNVQAEVITIINYFFGESITVSGLITGKDLMEQLEGRDLGDCLLLPCNMLRSGKNVFLDDVTVEEVEERLKTPVQIIDEPGSDLVKAVVEENQETIHRRRTMYEQADCSNCGPAERG